MTLYKTKDSSIIYIKDTISLDDIIEITDNKNLKNDDIVILNDVNIELSHAISKINNTYETIKKNDENKIKLIKIMESCEK